jgi:hypothetical protein
VFLHQEVHTVRSVKEILSTDPENEAELRLVEQVIRQRVAQVRSGWTDAEAESRAVYRATPAEIPEVAVVGAHGDLGD